MNTVSSEVRVSDQIIDALRSVIGEQHAVLHEPVFDGNEWNYLRECLDSTYVSSVGEFVDRLENELASYTGARYAVATVNGTAALHIALKLAGVKSCDEVLMPALTFVATANAVAYCGAIPHFVDCEEHTLGINAVKLREYLVNTTEIIRNQCINRYTGRVIRAVVPVHVFGHPADIEEIQSVAGDFYLKLIEDATESLGSTFNGPPSSLAGKGCSSPETRLP